MKKHILRGIVDAVLAMVILICGYTVGRGGFNKSVNGEKSRLYSLIDEIYSEDFGENIDQIGEIGGEWVLKSFRITEPLNRITDLEELTNLYAYSNELCGERIIIDDKDYTITLQGEKYGIGTMQISDGEIEFVGRKGYPRYYDYRKLGISIGSDGKLYFWQQSETAGFLHYRRAGMYTIERVADD